MKYRYERIINGTGCYITIEWNGSVKIIDSIYAHLIGLTYPNLETFEKQYPDYKMSTSLYSKPSNISSGAATSILKSNPFLWMDDLDNLVPDRINKMPIGCSHTFVPYVGIVETFEYCTKCDAKKGK